MPTSWSNGSLACGVAQGEYLSIFTNEQGDQSRVIFVGTDQVVALDWGDRVGTINATSNGLQIRWKNGGVWSSP